MANFNEIKNYAEKRSIYDFFTSGNFINKGLVVTIAICIIGGFFMMIIGHTEREAMNRTWNKVKPGDSLYAKEEYTNDSAYSQLNTYRTVRPINADDINAMNIPKWQKIKLITQLDTSAEHNRHVMVIYGKMLFLQDNFFKAGTAFVGTYVKSDSTISMQEERLYFPKNWHQIIPNRKLCDSVNYVFKMPEGYVFADSAFYMDPSTLNLSEPKVFKTKKK